MTTTLAAPQAAYRDPKRYAWAFSLLVPAAIGAGPLMMLGFHRHWLLWLPLAIAYGVVPFLDFIFGEDKANPPDSAVPGLEADRYYRAVTWALVPLLWLAHGFAIWFVMDHDLSAADIVAVVMATGLCGGFCINLGHELGHKRDPIERWLAKIVLAPTAYGHFYVEHNRGHHRDVATPADPASSRMGETLYRFALRELPGAFRRAWALEAERLGREGKSAWSLQNDVIQPALITLAYWTVLTICFGPKVLPLLVVVAFWSNFQLTMVNYLEHYGLLRRVRPDGRVELCRPHHSWNSNHIFSNWALFHLQRHSDHHAHPIRRYQSLRHFENLPTLPSGYFGLMPITLVPSLWFRLMDRRLIAAVGGDVSKINFQPGMRERLIRKYALNEELPEGAAGL